MHHDGGADFKAAQLKVTKNPDKSYRCEQPVPLQMTKCPAMGRVQIDHRI